MTQHSNQYYPTNQIASNLNQNEAIMFITIAGDIWAKFKKVVSKKYDVPVTAFFYPNCQKKVWSVYGGFMLNTAATDGWPEPAKRLLVRRFEDSAEHWISEFEEILTAFMDDSQNGFVACKRVYKIGRKEYRKILNEFLRSVKLIRSLRP